MRRSNSGYAVTSLGRPGLSTLRTIIGEGRIRELTNVELLAVILMVPPETAAEMAEDVFGTDDIELKQLMMLVPAYSDTDRPESHDLAEVAEAVRWLQSLLAR